MVLEFFGGYSCNIMGYGNSFGYFSLKINSKIKGRWGEKLAVSSWSDPEAADGTTIIPPS